MRRLILFVLLLAGLLAPRAANAQSSLAGNGNTVLRRYTGAPTGTCNAFWLAVNNATGAFYDCTAGVWTLVGTPGAGVSGSGTAPEVSYWSGATTLGSITGLTNGAGTNCDGFGTECKLKLSTAGTYGILTVPVGGPAGGYTFSELAFVDGTHLSESIGAYDGALQTGLTLHTLNGAYLSPSTTSPKFIFPEAPVTACVNIPPPFADAICEQAAASTLTYSIIKPPGAAQGTLVGRNTASVITQGFSGDADHSNGSAGTTIGSGTSIGSTSLCSTLNCPVGTYRVNVYVDITTACGATGTYVVNLIYTDDQGSKTVVANIQGTGSVPATGVLTLSSTANFGHVSQIVRSTGAASINYSTTAGACGAGGPMVGKLYLSVEPVQ